ncbi:pseudouridine synthase [Beijerinckia indica]|uniref:pseudouridine synthase n=1 Tax=Beijerinckia indica TaxID=533 RepID=UPI00244DA749|nr:pseudouridine synthase [Beijerinckia indica]
MAKVMARAGLCSRRDAEAWIAEGRVSVNGTVLTQPGVSVSDEDVILVDGEKLAARGHTRLFLFHKPRGLVTTNHDPEGRPTVFDYLHERHPDMPRVLSIGRLDINTEGLLLLTNDGGLSRLLELPTTGWVRRYRVRAKGTTDQAVLDQLRQGITIDGIHYAGMEVTFDREQGANSWLTLSLREGKNREVKRVLEQIGLEVNRLIRLSFGPFQLGDLPEGDVTEVRTRVLRDQLGPSLAAAAGVDWTRHDEDAAEPAAPERARKTPSKTRTEGKSVTKSHGAAPRPSSRTFTKDKPREDEHPARTAKPAPRSRKHISLLRAEDENRKGAPRKRVEAQEIADRHGRVVTVEHRVTAGPTSKRAEPATRNAKRFAAAHAAAEKAERYAKFEAKKAKGLGGEAHASRGKEGKPKGAVRGKQDTRPQSRKSPVGGGKSFKKN